MIQNFVSLAKSSAKEHMLTAILQKTIELTAELTKAETGSLFLLDPDGVVRDCILTLLHSQPGIFHQGTVDVMEVTAGQLGLVLESATLSSKLNDYSRALDAELEKGKQIQGTFLYPPGETGFIRARVDRAGQSRPVQPHPARSPVGRHRHDRGASERLITSENLYVSLHPTIRFTDTGMHGSSTVSRVPM